MEPPALNGDDGGGERDKPRRASKSATQQCGGGGGLRSQQMGIGEPGRVDRQIEPKRVTVFGQRSGTKAL